MEVLRSSKAARILTAAATVSFLFLLQPYCHAGGAADAAVSDQKAHEHAGDKGHAHSTDRDTCPSLSHTPAFPTNAVLWPGNDNSTGKLPVIARVKSDAGVSNALSAVIPRATPPPPQLLPIYLRYAQLLM